MSSSIPDPSAAAERSRRVRSQRRTPPVRQSSRLSRNNNPESSSASLSHSARGPESAMAGLSRVSEQPDCGPLFTMDSLVSLDRDEHCWSNSFEPVMVQPSSSEDDNSDLELFGDPVGAPTPARPTLSVTPRFAAMQQPTERRAREVFNLLEQRQSRQRVRRRRLTPKASAPPLLILYQTDETSQPSDVSTSAKPLRGMGAVPQHYTESNSPSQQNEASPVPSSIHYLPLVQAPRSLQGRNSIAGSTKYMIQPSHKQRIESNTFAASKAEWVKQAMPVELFEIICHYLSRDDIKNMRLVNKEFERGVSGSLFNTVVVPFNTELYDMIEHDKGAKRDLKGKRREDDSSTAYIDLEPGTLHWKNAMEDKEDKLYRGHGLRVFEGFGAHIHRFGMSFEIDEDALHHPPEKKVLDQLQSYFGSYDWPTTEYTRFDKLAGLEKTADETSQMKLAFSHLDKVQQLALSMNSGLGWMTGPDKSMRSRILKRPAHVFGCSHAMVNSSRQEREALWELLETTYRNAGKLSELQEGQLVHLRLNTPIAKLPGLSSGKLSKARLWSRANLLDTSLDNLDDDDFPRSGVLYVQRDFTEFNDFVGLPPTENDNRPDAADPPNATEAETSQDAAAAEADIDGAGNAPGTGIAVHVDGGNGTVTRPETSLSAWHGMRLDTVIPRIRHALDCAIQRAAENPPVRKAKKASFRPANLNKHQKEWLLEAEWAQRAFLMSYMLAVVDNSAVFAQVTVLNLARISGRLVPLLSRDDFWAALPRLEDVTLGVIPDWRTIERDEAGFVETNEVWPSKAHNVAFRLMQDYIGVMPNIRKLKFGWIGGGEHAEGVFARNNHVLAAPVTLLSGAVEPLSQEVAIIKLPHVEHLILSNCWISPIVITKLVKQLEKDSLTKVTFDSVSLIAHPNGLLPHVPNAGAAVGVGAGFGVGAGLGMNAVVGAAVGLTLAPLHPFAQPPGVFPPLAAQNYGALFWQGPAVGQAHNMWAQAMLQHMQHMMQQNNIQQHELHTMWTNHPAGMTLGQMAHTLHVWAGQPQHAHGAGAVGTFVPNAGPPPPAHPAAVGNAAANTAANNNANNTANQPRQWYDGHREGSWVDIIDTLTPGPNLAFYHPRDEFASEPEKRDTPLLKLEFVSCGYVQLNVPAFDQSMLEPPTIQRYSSPYFSRRRSALAPAMLNSSDRFLGRIVQHMREREQNALRFAWGMRMGWEDEKLAEESQYDGYAAGGTGRFSGVVTRDMAVNNVSSG